MGSFDDRRVTKRLHAILLRHGGQNADAVSAILDIRLSGSRRSIIADRS
jgi:hypothetical protein